MYLIRLKNKLNQKRWKNKNWHSVPFSCADFFFQWLLFWHPL